MTFFLSLHLWYYIARHFCPGIVDDDLNLNQLKVCMTVINRHTTTCSCKPRAWWRHFHSCVDFGRNELKIVSSLTEWLLEGRPKQVWGGVPSKAPRNTTSQVGKICLEADNLLIRAQVAVSDERYAIFHIKQY